MVFLNRHSNAMFENYSDRARKVMAYSRQEAQRRNADFIGGEHILLGISMMDSGAASTLLRNLGVDRNRIRQEIDKLAQPAWSPGVPLGPLPFNPQSRRTIELAEAAAAQLGDKVIGTEHILFGLVKEGGGVSGQVLANIGLTLQTVRSLMLEVLGADLTTEIEFPQTGQKVYAWEPRLSSIAQQVEHRHLLSRKLVGDAILNHLQEGNNVVLVGPPGVGKTSLALILAAQDEYTYVGVDYRILDPFFAVMSLKKTRGDVVRFMAEGELLLQSRSGSLDRLVDASQRIGDRLMIELRELPVKPLPGFETIEVTPPDERESKELLKSAATLLNTALSEEVLIMAASLAQEQLPRFVSPWGAVLLVWEAALPSNEASEFQRRIDGLATEKREAISLEDFERAASIRDEVYRLKRERNDKSPKTDITLDDLQAAIDRMK